MKDLARTTSYEEQLEILRDLVENKGYVLKAMADNDPCRGPVVPDPFICRLESYIRHLFFDPDFRDFDYPIDLEKIYMYNFWLQKNYVDKSHAISSPKQEQLKSGANAATPGGNNVSGSYAPPALGGGEEVEDATEGRRDGEGIAYDENGYPVTDDEDERRWYRKVSDGFKYACHSVKTWGSRAAESIRHAWGGVKDWTWLRIGKPIKEWWRGEPTMDEVAQQPGIEFPVGSDGAANVLKRGGGSDASEPEGSQDPGSHNPSVKVGSPEQISSAGVYRQGRDGTMVIPRGQKQSKPKPKYKHKIRPRPKPRPLKKPKHLNLSKVPGPKPLRDRVDEWMRGVYGAKRVIKARSEQESRPEVAGA